MELHTKNFNQLVVGFKRGTLRERMVSRENFSELLAICQNFQTSSNFYICYTVTGNNAAVAIATAIHYLVVYLTSYIMSI